MTEQATPNQHGGRRAGAGRKCEPGQRRAVPHRSRPDLSSRHPVHTVLRLRAGFPQLRTRQMYRAIRAQLRRYLGRTDFRVVHASIQDNHLHFLVEAADRRALARGMQSLAINLARGLHAACGGGCGPVFAQRYHATQIRTARQARNTLAYILNNWRHHRQDFLNGRMINVAADLYASGFAFTGWSENVQRPFPAGYEPLEMSSPRTTLLRWEWHRYGRIDPFECPGPIDRAWRW